MRLVQRAGPGEVELRYLWMPTWIGSNSALQQEIEKQVAPLLIGLELTNDVLDRAHDEVVSFLQKKFPELQGLSDYLDAIKMVQG